MKMVHINETNLKVIRHLASESVFALGFFDGLHLGHCKVIETAKGIAAQKQLETAVVTFYPHPKEVLNQKTKVDYLMPLHKKAEKLAQMNVDTLYVIRFDESFSQLSPSHFVQQYLVNLKAKHVVAGFDYCYGMKGAGKIDCLKEDAQHLLDVTKVDKYELFGEKISSTCIREALKVGNIEKINTFLGRSYEVEGQLVNDYFTPNSYYSLPAAGIYEVVIKSGKDNMNATVEVGENTNIVKMLSYTKNNSLQEVILEWKKCKQ